MDNKGFTLVELLATIIILGIITGFTIAAVNANIKKTKEKSELIFVETIEDAINMYMDTDAKSKNFSAKCSNELTKSTGNVSVYYTDVTLSDIIGTEYSPLLPAELINPNNEGVSCKTTASVRIYRDLDYVYYYKMAKSVANFGCLTIDLTGNITNIPGEFSC